MYIYISAVVGEQGTRTMHGLMSQRIRQIIVCVSVTVATGSSFITGRYLLSALDLPGTQRPSSPPRSRSGAVFHHFYFSPIQPDNMTSPFMRGEEREATKRHAAGATVSITCECV